MRRNILATLLVAIVAAGGLGTGFVPSASALTISPAIVEYDVNPGDALSGSIKLRNETSEKGTYYTAIKDFDAADESGTPKFLDKAGARSLTSWVSFDQSSVTLEPGETAYVTYNLTIPSRAAAGGYFGGLLFSTAAAKSKEGVGAVATLSALMIVRVSGEVVESGKITDFMVADDMLTSLPVNFRARFQNTGTVHVKPVGYIQIKNIFGGTSIVPVNEAGGNVLPDSARKFDANWQKSQLSNNASEFARQWRNFGFGPYKATLFLQYGESQQIATATVSFWVIPWLLIVLGLILFVALGFLLVQYNKWVVTRAHLKR